MIKKSGSLPIKVALHGMDPRSRKTMELYLKGPCRGIAVVVDEAEAEIDILDADYPTAGDVLTARSEKQVNRPIILLSLERLNIQNTHFLQKPVKAAELVEMLVKVRPKILVAKVKREPQENILPPSTSIEQSPSRLAQNHKPTHNPQEVPVKRRSAMQMNEGGYTGFLGTLSDIDFNDPEHLANAFFDPKRFFLGFVQSAYKVARAEGKALQLQSMWKPLIIYPGRQQVWLDADEKHLRVMAGIEQNKTLNSYVSLIPFDVNTDKNHKEEDKFQDMDAFLWKLTIWTSKGRLPIGLNIQHPVFLKQWPNFTRLMITPDSMRISALLAQGPRTPLAIIQDLGIRPEFAFAFIAACHAIGILDQSTRHTDELVVPEKPKVSKKPGLLGKILSKLRGE
jgi:hypothetical protein